MNRTLEIHVLQDGRPAHTLLVGLKPLSIGRAPTNDLVLPDGLVSWNHLMVWVDADGAWLKDLGSSNGTFVNDQRAQGLVQLNDGDTIRVGPDQLLQVQLRAETERPARAFALEDVDARVRFPIHSDRFTIGSSERANLHLDDGPSLAATLIVYPEDGEFWLGRDEQDEPIELGTVFQVAGRNLRVVEVDVTRAPTTQAQHDRYPYLLQATLNGPTGPVATLRDPGQDLEHEVSAGNRAVLLYLLGRQVVEDREGDRPVGERGWCADNDVSVGVWGRTRGAGITSGLHVLIYRIRQELKSAGFDPWCIEKRRKYVRLRVSDVELE
ncbi:MAG: FHA domain-containing protein [Alphaproteobacteria bacterium]|nr:FHA domain-containing protein [Alphaproteobacteria bacterium]